MPCRDDFPYSMDMNSEQVMHRSKVAELLCTLCKDYISRFNGPGYMPVEVQAWWKEHQRLDTEKEAQERN